jgi:hypothetical protein
VAIIKVSIKNKNTLELQEDGRKGDVIDLSALNGADISAVTVEIKNIARKEVEKEIAELKDKELENELLKQEKELKDKYLTQIRETQKENDKLKADKDRLQEDKERDVTAERQKWEIIVSNKEKELTTEIESKNKEIDLLKDLRLKQSTKMLGETLERHCDVSFETIRGFLPTSIYYGKDTDAKEGSMGDRIYREFDGDENEVLSIMFEMKNEADKTMTKQKNEHFFKELEKDRTQKKCEYAVLVSLLEKDNDIYDGIYTVPGYKDMFVIRPQDFTKIIMWLRGVNNKLASARNELAVVRNHNIDIAEFENKFVEVRDKFGKHYSSAVDKHNSAVEEIDKIIKELTKMRDYLTGSDRQLQLALNDLDDLTVENLAKKSPSIKAEIKKLKTVK